MRIVGILFLIFSLTLLYTDRQLYGQNSEYTNFKVEENIRVAFAGKPTRYFYQTPLGDITIYEYKPEAIVDSNSLYSIALYKTSGEEIKDINLSNRQTDVKYTEIINSDEMSVNNLGGKILAKEDINYKGANGTRMKILFSNLSELNEIEGQKNVIYNVIYLKQKSWVIKLWTYTPASKENKKIDIFFNSLTFN
jgi:hypothetical protein